MSEMDDDAREHIGVKTAIIIPEDPTTHNVVPTVRTVDDERNRDMSSPIFMDSSYTRVAEFPDDMEDFTTDSAPDDVEEAELVSSITSSKPKQERSKSGDQSLSSPTVSRSPNRTGKRSQSASDSSTNTSPKEKVRKLIPRRLGITWSVGCRLEAMDYLKKWYPARIVAINEENQEVLIHFDGWNARFDEWLDMRSDRLRATQKRVTEKPPVEENIVVGTMVLARWTVGSKYPAFVKSLMNDGSVNLEFYDGEVCTVKITSLQTLTKDLQKEAKVIWDLLKKVNDKPLVDVDSLPRREALEIKKLEQAKVDEAELRLSVLLEKASKQIKPTREECEILLDKDEVTSAATSKSVTSTVSSRPVTVPSTSKSTSSTSATSKPVTTVSASKSDPSTTATHENMGKPRKRGRPSRRSITEKLSESGTTEQQMKEVEDRQAILKTDTNEEKVDKTEEKQKLAKDEEGAKSRKRRRQNSEHEQTKQQENSRESSEDIPLKDIKIRLQQESQKVAAAVTDCKKAGPVVGLTKLGRKSIESRTSADSPAAETKSSAVSSPPAKISKLSFTTERRRKSSKAVVAEEPKPMKLGYALVLDTGIASKAFTVKEDHYQFKCSHCSKGFRKELLLQSHVKYYHTAASDRQNKPKLKRKTSQCLSDTDMISPGTPVVSLSTCKGMSKKSSEVSLDAGTDTAATSCNMAYDADTDEDVDDQTEVVNCVCGFNEEDDLMVQCDFCCCWQHAVCFNLKADSLPERYLCFICLNTPGVRESSRYIHDQDWWRFGKLAKFKFLTSVSDDWKREKTIRRTHTEVAKLQRCMQALGGMRKLTAAVQNKSEELSHWVSLEERIVHPELSPTVKDDKSVKEDEKSDSEEVDEASQNLLRYLAECQDDIEKQLDEIESVVAELEKDADATDNVEDMVTINRKILTLLGDLSKVKMMAAISNTATPVAPEVSAELKANIGQS